MWTWQTWHEKHSRCEPRPAIHYSKLFSCKLRLYYNCIQTFYSYYSICITIVMWYFLLLSKLSSLHHFHVLLYPEYIGLWFQHCLSACDGMRCELDVDTLVSTTWTPRGRHQHINVISWSRWEGRNKGISLKDQHKISRDSKPGRMHDLCGHVNLGLNTVSNI